jgi:hypothetical protein
MDSSHLTQPADATVQARETKLRILEIESELAEMKRRYIVDGIEGDLARRVTLEAELASLSIVRFKNRVEAEERKMAAKETKAQKFQALLCAKVEAAGLSHLIKEAQAESLEYITAAGLYPAYAEKGTV